MNGKLRVNEIFYSIQGEGTNAGMPAVFVRLAGCNLYCPYCDTAHEAYTEMDVEEILDEVSRYAPCRTIIWTGGEPTLQLTGEVLAHFASFYNCIETNGTNPVPDEIDYIACSPKIPACLMNKNRRANELRYPIKAGEALPRFDQLPAAHTYFLSPIDVSQENVEYCLKLIKENPQWKLSVQIHKLLRIR